jgi:hypothetical protein
MIERRAIRRSRLTARGAATLPRLTRWQRWADALRARSGRALGAPNASGMSFRRMRAGAPLLAVQQRFESVLVASPTYGFDLRRSAVVRNESWHVQPRQQTLVRVLMRATPAAREASPSQPPRRAAPPKIALTQRLVSRISSVLLERRLLSRAVAHADGARAAVMVERIRPPRPALRQATAVDDIPQRLLRRAERQVAAAAALPPVRSVLARPAPPRALERAEGLAPPRPRGIAAREATPHVLSAPPVLNLDRITEQVIDRLDRRIIAQRERMGRV